MSHSNNMTLRAKFRDDGTIVGFVLGNYSGGDWFNLRLHRVEKDDFYWVLEGNGFKRTLFLRPLLPTSEWSGHDVDEIGLDALKLWREDGLEQQDTLMRTLIRETTGKEMPLVAPGAPSPKH